jgi:transcription initiation factor TFIID subunit 7
MGDRSHHRDRTLILRILVPTLGSAIRDKMSYEQDPRFVASQRTRSAADPDDNAAPPKSSSIWDLEGVTIEPAALPSHSTNKVGDATLWSFRCDGAQYPARLVNLPCPVELHKTTDHITYYKSVDVAQMLIVYEDMQALEEAESTPGYSVEGFSTYFHSGLTPPMTRVVERRFAAREHKAVAPPSSEIAQVEVRVVWILFLFHFFSLLSISIFSSCRKKSWP